MSDVGARRRVGTLSLTFVAVGGVVGSGILFAPLFAAQAAGPAAILAWPIAGVMMILIALTFAEVAAMQPVVGGLGRLPAFSHGPGAGAAVGWVTWIGYVTAAPIETQAMREYTSNEPVFAGGRGVRSGDLRVGGALRDAGGRRRRRVAHRSRTRSRRVTFDRHPVHGGDAR